MKNTFLLSILIFGVVFNGSAQTSFSSDPNVFITEFTKYIKDAKKTELTKSVEAFATNWKTNKITPEQQKNIIKITNNMMYKQLPRDQYFELLVSNLDLYFKKKLNPNILKQWQDISKTLLDKNPKDYLAFMQTANTLFTDNTLYKSGTTRWYASNSNFDISLVNNKICISFKSLDLICENAVDKIKILNCAGSYFSEKTNWVGTKGKINWERLGKPETEILAEFKTHKIDLSISTIIVDSVLLKYPKISATPILGRLIDKLTEGSAPDLVKKSGFPAFAGYQPSIEIKGIVGDKAIYRGGFSMAGAAVNSQTFGGGMASINLLYKGKPLVELKSEAFKLDSGNVLSLHTDLKIKVDTGFITHPNCIINYNIKKKRLTVTKGSEGLMRMPFSDNYHSVEIDVERIIWGQDSAYIDFDNISKDKAAKVETNTFFKKITYETKQGALALNPLDKIFGYCRTFKLRSFHINDYAANFNQQKANLQQQFMDLSDDGFLYYNTVTDSVYVRDKLFNWVSSNLGGKDYDVIRLSSVIAAKPNVTYNIGTNELKVEGVRKFNYSDSQNVIAVPTNQLVIFQKNKNMHYAGLTRAGRIDFYSKDFNFNWRSFQIANTTMDSMVIFYPDLNTNALRKVESVLSNTYGRILIDKPNNKSGLRNYAEYPIFIAERGSEINYDRGNTHNHAYKRDEFKFEIDPFTIDSLDNFTIAGFGFGGTLVSDGIFPDIKSIATIQPDYSLGFVTPVKLPMYGGKGTGDLTINLSNRGFYGRGDLIYETSISKSPEYLLLPDATVGTSNSFYLPESAKYPLVNGSNVQTQWYPKQDKMFQTRMDSNFAIFKQKYAFDGKLTLAPADLRGQGKLLWPEAVFASNDMVFGKNKSKADVSSIKVYTVDPNKFAFESNNVKGDVDFDKREGKFLSNVVGSYTHFPYNNYSSNMSDYKWDMTKKTMDVKPGLAMATMKPLFVGLPANTPDSVKFECAFAKFDLVQNVLYMEKIPFIDVADSRVFPFAGKAIVREKAAMDRLDSSRIEANKLDKFHEIKNCHTTITGGNRLAADGFYRYIDKYKIEQPIRLDSIRIDKDRHLVGYGKIAENKFLKLDKKIVFKGLFEIISTAQPIRFIGYVKPLHTFTFINSTWMKYDFPVDPKNVIINTLNPRDYDNHKLSVGLYFAKDSNHVYPWLYGMKKFYSDYELQSDTGILYYDDVKDAFFAGNEDKLLKKSLKGNFMQLNEKDKSVYTEGRYNFQIKAPKVICETAGTAVHSAKDSTYRFNLMMLLNFPIPKEVNDKITKFLTAEGAGKAPGSLKNIETKKAIAELISEPKIADKIQRSIDAAGILPPEGEFKNGFVFSNVNFGFNRIKRKFIGTGSITMPLFNGTIINKSYTATVAIEKKRSADKITIYLVADNGEYIFIEYAAGTMFIASNNAELNTAVTLASEKYLDPEFTLRLGSEKMKDKFLLKNDVEIDE